MVARCSEDFRNLCKQVKERIEQLKELSGSEALASYSLRQEVYPRFYEAVLQMVEPDQMTKQDACCVDDRIRAAYLSTSCLVLDRYVSSVGGYLSRYKNFLHELDVFIPDIKEYTIRCERAKYTLGKGRKMLKDEDLSDYKLLDGVIGEMEKCCETLKITKDACNERMLELDKCANPPFWKKYLSEICVALGTGLIVTIGGGLVLWYLQTRLTNKVEKLQSVPAQQTPGDTTNKTDRLRCSLECLCDDSRAEKVSGHL